MSKNKFGLSDDDLNPFKKEFELRKSKGGCLTSIILVISILTLVVIVINSLT